MPAYYLKKSKLILENEGPISLLCKASKKARLITFRANTSIWMTKTLGREMHELTHREGFSVIMDDIHTIFQWIERKNDEFPWMYNEKERNHAIQHGHIIPFIRHREGIVGYTKVALSKVYIRGYNSVFTLAPNKAMFYDTTILPEFRRQDLSQFLKLRILKHLADRDIQQVFAHIPPWNIPSIRSNKKLGFSEIFINRFFCVLGMKFHTNNPRKYLRNASLTY